MRQRSETATRQKIRMFSRCSIWDNSKRNETTTDAAKRRTEREREAERQRASEREREAESEAHSAIQQTKTRVSALAQIMQREEVPAHSTRNTHQQRGSELRLG